MDSQTQSEHVVFIKDALLTLIGQIRNYCESGSGRVMLAPRRQRADEAMRYVQSASRLIDEVYVLLDLARRVEVMQTLNLEQLEAEADLQRRRVEAVAMRELAIQN